MCRSRANGVVTRDQEDAQLFAESAIQPVVRFHIHGCSNQRALWPTRIFSAVFRCKFKCQAMFSWNRKSTSAELQGNGPSADQDEVASGSKSMFRFSKARAKFGSSLDLRKSLFEFNTIAWNRTKDDMQTDSLPDEEGFVPSCDSELSTGPCVIEGEETARPRLRRRHSFTSMEMMIKMLSHTISLWLSSSARRRRLKM